MAERIFRLADFREYLRMLEAERADYALIGGHAVALWTVRYLPDEQCAALGIDMPLLSKDLDLRAEESVARSLATSLRTVLTHAQFKKQPHMGKTRAIVVHLHGHSTTIEILQRVPGLDPSANEPPQGHVLRLPLEDIRVRVLDPVSLFIAKAHTYIDTREANEAGRRNDGPHLRLLTALLPAYFTELDLRHAEGRIKIEPAAERARLRACLDFHGDTLPLSADEIRAVA